jgi:hypothetical protein
MNEQIRLAFTSRERRREERTEHPLDTVLYAESVVFCQVDPIHLWLYEWR